MESILDNIGLPFSGINVAYSNSGVIGSEDADILVGLKQEHHPVDNYVRQLRRNLANQFPGITFYFLPADMVTQILNFGLPAPLTIASALRCMSRTVGVDSSGTIAWTTAPIS